MADTNLHPQEARHYSDASADLEFRDAVLNFGPIANDNRPLSEIRSDSAEFVLSFGDFVRQRHGASLSWDGREDLRVVMLAFSQYASWETATPTTVRAIRMALKCAEEVYAELQRAPAIGFSSTGWIAAIRDLVRREMEELDIRGQ